MLADAIVVKYIRSIIKDVSTRESDHHDGKNIPSPNPKMMPQKISPIAASKDIQSSCRYKSALVGETTDMLIWAGGRPEFVRTERSFRCPDCDRGWSLEMHRRDTYSRRGRNRRFDKYMRFAKWGWEPCRCFPERASCQPRSNSKQLLSSRRREPLAADRSDNIPLPLLSPDNRQRRRNHCIGVIRARCREGHLPVPEDDDSEEHQRSVGL